MECEVCAEKSLQDVSVQKVGPPEHPISIETSVRTQYMQVGMDSKKVTKRQNCNNGPGHGIIFRNNFLEEFLALIILRLLRLASLSSPLLP
jgi:hypothetical protein